MCCLTPSNSILTRLFAGRSHSFYLGYLVYLALIRPVRNRSHFMQILMTTGIGLILTDSAQLIFKPTIARRILI